jgi:hypothetical protein
MTDTPLFHGADGFARHLAFEEVFMGTRNLYSKLASSSSGVVVAVPILPTTIPAA